MADEHVETEVKFWVESLDAISDRLAALGATQVSERALEMNIRLDRPDRSLSSHGQALRLRRSRPSPRTLRSSATPLPMLGEAPGARAFTHLTYKSRLAQPTGAGPMVKQLLEIEVEIGDFEQMQAILERLGFEMVFLYEKYRETFRLGETEVMLDELPYGCFVEIEGEVGDIEQTAAQLGLSPAQRVPGTYLSLFEAVRRRRGLPFRDLTFTNFRELHIVPEDLGLALPSPEGAEEGGP